MARYTIRACFFVAFLIMFSMFQKRDHTSTEGIIILAFAITWIIEPLFMNAVEEWDKKHNEPKEIKNKAE